MSDRARRGYTYDPCHACGRAVLRRKDKICDDCSRELEFARQRADELKMLGDQTPVPFYCKERDYALPYLHNTPSARGAAVQTALFNLGQLVSQPSIERPPMLPADDEHSNPHTDPKWYVWPFSKQDSRSSDWTITRSFVPPVAFALGAAFTAVREAITAAYKDGHDDGRRLLLQLASGEITSDQFNERAARIESTT